MLLSWLMAWDTLVPSKIIPVHSDLSECHQFMPTCLWLVNVSLRHHFSSQKARSKHYIFIILYGILPCFYWYLVHIIINKCACQESRHSDHKQWYCGVVRWGRVYCQTFGLDLVNFGLSWGVKMTKDGANITLQCILMIYNSW